MVIMGEPLLLPVTLVYYTAVFSVVTQRSSPRCVTTLKTAVQQTTVT